MDNKDNEIVKDDYKILIDTLKDKRIELNKTTKEIAQELFTSPENIKKLEKGQSLGNSSYMRLILKKYITSLNLKYEDYENVIKEKFPSIVEETIVLNEIKPQKLQRTKKNKDFKTIKKFISYFIFIVFIVFLFIITAYNIKVGTNKSQITNETTEIKETVLQPENVVKKPVENKEINIVDNTIEFSLKDTSSLNIKIHTTGEVYLDYSKNDSVLEQSTFKENQDIQYNFATSEGLKINIGSIENVEIEINDKDITNDLKNLKGQYYIIFKQQES